MKDNVVEILKYFIGLLFIFAGIMKYLNFSDFYGVLKVLDLFAPLVNLVIQIFVPFLEILLGSLILINWKYRKVMIVTFMMTITFWGISFYGLIVGLEDECGCFGPYVESQFGWWMFIRNSGLIAIIIFMIIAHNKKEEKNINTYELYQ
jgi:putative oxidoreductase